MHTTNSWQVNFFHLLSSVTFTSTLVGNLKALKLVKMYLQAAALDVLCRGTVMPMLFSFEHWHIFGAVYCRRQQVHE